VAFPDEDLDAAEIGGQIQWVEPQSTGSDRVEFYNLYLAEHPTGQSRSLLFDVAKGLSSVPLAANSALVDYQALLIYTISRLAEQTTPAYTLLSDTISIPTNLSFPDLDLDFDDVGGTLVWLEPDDTDFVTSYFVYMALPLEEAVDLGLCQGRPLLGSGAPQIFGSFTLSVVGASAQQVAVAAKAALSKALGIPLVSLIVSATPAAARRLSSGAGVQTWRVQYQARVSQESLGNIVAAARSFGADPTLFAADLAGQLGAVGIDSTSSRLLLGTILTLSMRLEG